MFTVKVYRSKDVGGRCGDHYRLDLHEGETVLVEDTGIAIYNDGRETTWVPKPELPGETENRTGERPDTFVAQVIIENSAGQTTEFIRA